MPVRKAGDKFNPAFTEDGQLSPASQGALDIIGEVSGKTSNVIRNEDLRGGSADGFVSFDKPQDIQLSPDTTAFVTAHEGMHSQLMTPLAKREVNNYLKYGGSYAPTDMNPMDVPREGGNQLRYRQEMEAMPRLLEEASAQGGATGVMNKLGLKNQDKGFQTGYDGNSVSYEGDVYRNQDGSVDSLAYPMMFRDKVVNDYTKQYGSMFEGKPLGMGIDPRFSDAERDVYYRIGENTRGRAKRQFEKSKALFE